MIFVSIQPFPSPLPPPPRASVIKPISCAKLKGYNPKTTRNYWKSIKYRQTLEHNHFQINASYMYLINAPSTLLKLY